MHLVLPSTETTPAALVSRQAHARLVSTAVATSRPIAGPWGNSTGAKFDTADGRLGNHCNAAVEMCPTLGSVAALQIGGHPTVCPSHAVTQREAQDARLVSGRAVLPRTVPQRLSHPRDCV